MFAQKIRTGLYRVKCAGVTHIIPGTNPADAICTLLKQVLL